MPASCFRLLDEKLEALADPPGCRFRLRCDPAGSGPDRNHPKRRSQFRFSDENAKAQIAFLIDRLSVRFGEHRVLASSPGHPHPRSRQAPPCRPRIAITAPIPIKRNGPANANRTIRRAGRCAYSQRPEEIASQVLPVVPDGPPTYFRWRQCRHDVARAEGPERIALEW